MSPCHFVAHLDFALLSDINPDYHICPRWQFITLFTGEQPDINYPTFFTIGNSQGVVADITGFFTKDGAEEFFFGGLVRFTLGSNFSHENIPSIYPRPNADNALFIQLSEGIFTNVGNFYGDFFGYEFGLSGFDLVFFDVNGSIDIFLD